MNPIKHHFPKYSQRGKLGYYGLNTDASYNSKVYLINQLVDKHNQLINTFKTEKENTEFYNSIIKEINDTIHEY